MDIVDRFNKLFDSHPIFFNSSEGQSIYPVILDIISMQSTDSESTIARLVYEYYVNQRRLEALERTIGRVTIDNRARFGRFMRWLLIYSAFTTMGIIVCALYFATHLLH